MDMQEISPEEIKRIRKSLGLSQAEAGKLLGGGPSAFAKYEKGSVRPSASLAKMLKFLRSRPEQLEALATGRENTAPKAGTTPFDIESKRVEDLTADQFSALIGKLLSAEAQESGIPSDGIHVCYKIEAPDGGEDARIEWQGGPARTSFLPNRLCQFQLKTGKIFPKRAGEEVLYSKKRLKPMIREVLEKGGSYIMLCSHDYSQEAIQNRKNIILENIREHLPKTEERQVQFRDSGQIAAWAAERPPVALWLLEKTRPALVNPSFGDWDHWSRRVEHSGAPWVEDPRLPDFREKLLSIVRTPKKAAKVMGPYGAGKSRLALEAFRPTQKEETSGVRLSDLVLYAVEPEAGTPKITELAWDLVNSKKRSVLVVDRCSEETRTHLEGIVRHSDSRVSLVTINDEVTRHAEKSEDAIVVGRAEHSFIEKVVLSVDPSISEMDRRRIVGFSDGVVLCARLISGSWSKDGLTASADDETLVKKFVGRDIHEHDRLYKAAMLMGAFGEVSVKSHGDRLVQLAAELRGGISVKDFHDAVTELKKRGIVSRYGDSLILRPEHIAIKLAKLQWELWDEILDENFPEALIRKTAHRLSILNTTETAIGVARKICHRMDLWFPQEKLEENSEVLVPLAETDAACALEVLEKILDPVSSIGNLSRNADHNVIRALRKIAFLDDENFENAARLLLEIETFENRNAASEHPTGNPDLLNEWAEAFEIMRSEFDSPDGPESPRKHILPRARRNPTDVFRHLFPAMLADTAAGPERRLRVIDEFIDTDDKDRLPVIIGALLEGAKTTFFHRTTGAGGPEMHGSRPALEPWRAKTVEEDMNYVTQCAERLVRLAKRKDAAGEEARAGLGRLLGQHVLEGLMDEVERWTEEVRKIHPYWPEALNSFDGLLRNHADVLVRVPPLREKVETLFDALNPGELKDRLRFLVTEMPDGYLGREKDGGDIDYDEMLKSQKNELERLAEDLLDRGNDMPGLLSGLSKGEHRLAREFGLCLAEKTRDPMFLKTLLTEAVEEAPDDERNFNLLIGYMEGLAQRDPEELEKFKKEAAKSPVFAPVLPQITSRTGIGREDAAAAVECMKSGLIKPGEMEPWGYTRHLFGLETDAARRLFNFMLEKNEPSFFSAAICLMEAYASEQGKREERLESLRPLLARAAMYPSIAGNRDDWSSRHYEEIMYWIVSKGGEDPDARAVGTRVARQVVREENLSYTTVLTIRRRLLPALLSGLAETAWPLIGRAIAENGSKMSKMQHFLMMLGHEAPQGNDAPILSLAENTLFGWCHANPEIGPVFAAKALPVTEKLYETKSYEIGHVLGEAIEKLRDGEKKITDDGIHPRTRRLLDEFGERGDVLDALESNIRDFCGMYRNRIILFREPLRSIAYHDKGPVRRRVGKMMREIDERTEEIRGQDKDRGIEWK